MKPLPLLGSLLALGHVVCAQAPTPPKPRAARPAIAMENQLIETGGFEAPSVQGRVSKDEKGGNFIQYAQGEWRQFLSNKAATEGGLKVGLTNEIARTGRQSLYVHFERVTVKQAAVDLVGGLVPVKAAQDYHVGLWGRIDAKEPLTLDQRSPLLRLLIEFYGADQETQIGESIYKVQPIPGTPKRPPLFTARAWNEFFTTVTAPAEAAYVKVTWSFLTPIDDGMTNGIIYFDDANIEGERPEPAPEPEPTEDKPAPPTIPGEAAPAGGASTAPAVP